MTKETKQKVSDQFFKLVPLGTFLTLLVFIFQAGSWKKGVEKDIETKAFRSNEERTEVISHSRNSLTPVELYFLKNHLKDSLDHTSDLDKKVVGLVMKVDTISTRNAITIYQMKESIEDIKKSVDELKKIKKK